MGSTLIKKSAAVFLSIILAVGWALPILAETPYRGYTYNHWAVLVPSPVAYVPLRSFSAADVCPELVSFVEPADIHISPNGYIFIVDTGNNRIVVFDEGLNLLRVIDGYYRDDEWHTFNQPNGVFVTQNLEIYVADTQNNRVTILDWEGNYLWEIAEFYVEGLEDDFRFLPLQVLVDRGGRIYVIVQHNFEGMMSFTSTGDFMGYFGTIEVWRSWIDIFWRFFMTETQIERQRRVIPTEFQSMALDEYNFIFTTNLEPYASNDQIMRLNPRGDDVMANMNAYITLSGDQTFRGFGSQSGPSQFIDVIARPNGMVSTLDQTRGRVYTYDSEGSLLYVFSGMGNIEGMTRRPVAIEIIGDDILVLDNHLGRILQFTPTEYGALINEAIEKRYQGDEAGAVDAWRRLVALDENFSLAWAGIGRSLLAEGDNAAAMYYLRRGMDLVHYSIAFRRHRMDVMQNALPHVFTAGTALIGLLIAYKIVRFIRRRLTEVEA